MRSYLNDTSYSDATTHNQLIKIRTYETHTHSICVLLCNHSLALVQRKTGAMCSVQVFHVPLRWAVGLSKLFDWLVDIVPKCQISCKIIILASHYAFTAVPIPISHGASCDFALFYSFDCIAVVNIYISLSFSLLLLIRRIKNHFQFESFYSGSG